MKILTGTMIAMSFLLTACGDFKSINKGSNEVLSSLSPYLSENDQVMAAELSEVYNEDIIIRENILDNQTIEIEIEGNVAQLEIVNKGKVAFRLNGKKILFSDLEDSELLESLISSSLINISSNASLLSLMDAKRSEAFLGSVLTSVFGLVVKGIFNFAMEKVTEKVGPEIGGAIGTLGDSLIGEVTGGVKPSDNQVNNAKDTIFNTILGTLLNKFTGGAVSEIPVVTNPNQPVVQQPQQNCNLFCGLFGLLVNNIVK